MNARDFVYWLQGFFEISETNELTERQVKMIKAHLNLVFKHEIDPSNLEGKTYKEIEEYIAIHRGAKDGDKIGSFFEEKTTVKSFPEVQINC